MLSFVVIYAPAKEKHICGVLTKHPKALCDRFDKMSLPEISQDLHSQSEGVDKVIAVDLPNLSSMVKELASAKTALEQRSVGEFEFLKPSLQPTLTEVDRVHKAGLTLSAAITCLTCLRHKNLITVKADDSSSADADAAIINATPKTTFLLQHLFCTLGGVAHHSLELPWQIVQETDYYRTRFGKIVPELSVGTAKGSTAAPTKKSD